MFVCEKGGRKRGISGSSSIPSYPLALNWCGEGTLHRSPVELCRFSFVFEKALESVKVLLFYIYARCLVRTCVVCSGLEPSNTSRGCNPALRFQGVATTGPFVCVFVCWENLVFLKIRAGASALHSFPDPFSLIPAAFGRSLPPQMLANTG